MLIAFESIVTEQASDVLQEAASMNSDLTNDFGVTTGVDSFCLAC